MLNRTILPRFYVLLALLVGLAATVIPAYGSVFQKAENYEVSPTEVIDEDLYIWANRVTVEGVVIGDLASFGFRVIIDGEVTNSATIFANNVALHGRIGGSLRTFAQDVTVDGYVGRSVLAFGQTVTISNTGVIERDLTVFANDITIEGAVKGDVTIKAGDVELAGVIAGDATIKAAHISLVKPAVIIGNLTYESEEEDALEIGEGVTITGRTIWRNTRATGDGTDPDEEEEDYTGLVFRVSSLLAAFLFGIIVVRLFRPYAEESFAQLRNRFASAFAAGLLGAALLVLCVIVLLFTIAMLIVGLIVISTDAAPFGSLILIFSILMLPITSFLSIAGAIIFYSGKIVLGFLVGYLILRNIKQLPSPLTKSTLFLGLVILVLAFSIPYVGFLLYLLASIIGAGAILLAIKNLRRASVGAPSAASAPPPVTPPAATPPPGLA